MPGNSEDKWAKFNVPKVLPGWFPYPENASEMTPVPIPAVSACVAHLECAVESVNSEWDDEHFIFHCRIDRCFVLKSHWSGTQFYPVSSNDLSPLSFLGSKTFVGWKTPSSPS